MAKDIIIAKSKDDAKQASPNLQLSEETWTDLSKNLEELNFFPILIKIIKSFYGPEADFEIKFEELEKLEMELSDLSTKNDFLDKLNELVKEARKKEENIYGFAD